MLKSIHLQGFKGFKDTKIDPIRKVNLILGGQNVGKTSLLEAVYLGGAGFYQLSNVGTAFRVAEGKDAERFNHSVFRGQSSQLLLGDSDIEISTDVNKNHNHDQHWIELDTRIINSENKIRRFVRGGALYSINKVALKVVVSSKDFFNPLLISMHLPSQIALVQLLDNLVISRKKKLLLGMLKKIEPRLEDMHSLSPDGELRIYVELNGDDRALPLPQLGHGFSRLVNLYCSLLETNAKLALIDEVENGIHYSSLPIVFKGIQDIATNNGVQTLITTHSWEAIRAAYNVFAEADALDDFQLIRLERDDDNIRAVVINDEQLVTAMESGYEIR